MRLLVYIAGALFALVSSLLPAVTKFLSGLPAILLVLALAWKAYEEALEIRARRKRDADPPKPPLS